MIRGYLALEVDTPPSDAELAVWSGHFEKSELLVSVMRGSLEVPAPISFQYPGGEALIVSRPTEPLRLPTGVYVVFMVPLRSPLSKVDEAMEREVQAQLDSGAGIVAALTSPNAIYRVAFEFLAEAGGHGTFVMSRPIRKPDELTTLDNAAFAAIGDALSRIVGASGTLPARARTSLRWFAQAHGERSRPEAFVKFWIALEALVFSGNGSPKPLISLLAEHYEKDSAGVSDTFAINGLAVLRNDIVHAGNRPSLHGKLLVFVSALYIDALRARLGLSNERRAESALPDGRPFQVGMWRTTGRVATGYLPSEKPEPTAI